MNRPSRQRSRAPALPMLAALALIASCSMIDYSRPPPEDFPPLAVRIVDAGVLEVNRMCGGIPILMHVVACTWIDWDTMTATIHTTTRDVEMMAHERAHTQGYEHTGSTEIRDHWARWTTWFLEAWARWRPEQAERRDIMAMWREWRDALQAYEAQPVVAQ